MMQEVPDSETGYFKLESLSKKMIAVLIFLIGEDFEKKKKQTTYQVLYFKDGLRNPGFWDEDVN